MAVATSGEKQITIDGQKFRVRTQVVYQDGLGVPGTLSTTAPIRYVVQYKPEPFLTSQFINLGERDVTNKNNWIFTNLAGAGFQKALIANGPTSLTTSLDDATANALSASSGVTKQQAIQVLETAPNVAPTVVAPTQPTEADRQAAAAAALGPQLETADLNIDTIASDGSVSDFGSDDNLRYPEKLDASKQDCIKFSQLTNNGRPLNDGGGIFGGLGSRSDRAIKINGTVTLPIQSGITDSNGVDWGGANLNAKDRFVASLALGGITSSEGLAERIGELVPKAVNQLKIAGENSSFRSAVNLYLAQEAAGIQGLLSRSAGAVLNPNLELLFNGPTLRPFNFTFRLSPRSEPEAANVRRIIRFFKEGMAVQTAVGGVFLKSPNIFEIKYIAAGANKHKSLPLIKQCALLGCDVDYTPDGTYMTFNDEAKTITSYQLTLRFSELDPIYNTDYDDHPIGY